jgi:ABC-type Fe3+-siderophore transport system permease subunit
MMSVLAKAAMVMGAVLIVLSYFHSYFALPWVALTGMALVTVGAYLWHRQRQPIDHNRID